MLYLTCTIISTVDRAHYGVSRAKDWVSVDYGTLASWRTTISIFFPQPTNIDKTSCKLVHWDFEPLDMWNMIQL